MEGTALDGVYSGMETTNMPSDWYTPHPTADSFTGTITDSSIVVNMDSVGPDICTGTISGNSGSGTWSNSDGSSSGTWSGSRTR